MTSPRLLETADAMRRAFDASFVEAVSEGEEETVDWLVVRSSDRRYALRLDHVRGVHATPTITWLPSASSTLLGIGQIRSRVVGMHHLAAVVDGTGTLVAGRWVALCGDGTIGLVFDELAARTRTTAAAIRRDASKVQQGLVAGVVEILGTIHSVVDLGAVVASIERVVDGGGDRREGSQE